MPQLLVVCPLIGMLSQHWNEMIHNQSSHSQSIWAWLLLQGRTLTVKRSELKKKSGTSRPVISRGSKVAVQVNKRTKAALGKKQSLTRKVNTSLNNRPAPARNQRKPAKPQRTLGQKGQKRVVDFPQLTDLRITIQNDRVSLCKSDD